MSSPTIRRLGVDDLAAMRALNALFADVFADPESYARHPPDDAYLIALLAKPHLFVLVAEFEGAVVGGLTAYQLEKFEQARSEVYIYDLAVAEAHRRRGFARALIAGLQRFARDVGAWVVYVQADYGDEPAIALYTRLGTREDVMNFDLPIAPED